MQPYRRQGRKSEDTVRWISRKYIVRMGGGWNWLRVTSNSRVCN